MAGNEALNARNRNSADEWYTSLVDIEKELRHYRKQFRGKTVFLNCDDPYESNFFRYFAMNFNHLGLKKLIATSYAGSPVVGEMLPLEELAGLSVDEPPRDAFKVEITEVPDLNDDGSIDLLDVEHLLRHDANVMTPLKGDGDFRSEESRALLDEADIVVTNPPFSLILPFVEMLGQSGKKFIFLGDQNFVTYDKVFEQVMAGNLWFGYDNGGTKWFRVPDDYEIKTESRKKIVDGVKYFSMGRIVWFTNMDTTYRHELLTLFARYTPEEYPTYTNYPAIHVSHVAKIPMDYEGEMAVPITILSKLNPAQFEVIGNTSMLAKPMKEIAPKGSFTGRGDDRFYLPNGDGTYARKYDRIVIRRIGPAS